MEGQDCGGEAGVRTGMGTKAYRLEQIPGEISGEELRSEHRTCVSWTEDSDTVQQATVSSDPRR